jgi:hypothetical protein
MVVLSQPPMRVGHPDKMRGMRRLLALLVTAWLVAGGGLLLGQSSTATKLSTPPIPNPGFVPSRPVDVVRSVYEFAGQHPEVLKFVPCYCGCEANGHPHNESCFVKRRDAKGNVAEWDPHGFGCQICIDVARDAMLMYRSGADPVAIRSSIEKKWTPKFRTKTPTPNPPPAKKR